MNNYELTERGKIIVAVVLVIVLLVIPGIIFGISSCSGSSPGDVSNTADPDTGLDNSPSIANTPPSAPDGGVTPSPSASPGPQETATPDIQDSPAIPPDTPAPSDPPPSASPGGNGNGNGDSNDEEETIESGPIRLNIAAGTMAFVYIPDEQDDIDTETADMLKDFLSSPKNTGGSVIKVEVPDIDTTDEDVLFAAVLQAFSEYNIPESKLIFVKNDEKADDGYIVVALSYSTISNQK